MKKNYIKMNEGNYLSLGNLFNEIKKISKGNSAMQSEIFCTLFNVNEINSQTVNNYCIGIRAIGIEYKKKYIDCFHIYKKDRSVFVNTIISLISILDEHIYLDDEKTLKNINNNHNLYKLCVELLKISKKDINVNEKFTLNLGKLIDNNDLYDCIIDFLEYIILENKQPIYKQDINIKINEEELTEYLKIKLYEGFSHINSLRELSKRGNMYACADLGSLEFDGLVDGKHNYKISYYYYMIAADKGHPKACWMIANMILTKKVKYDFDTLWKYLNESIKLGSAAGLNTMGKCYLLGINPKNECNIEKAKDYFIKSSELGYTFAFNNLGLLCSNEDEAVKYYKTSADMNESWALNKMGEYYRKKGNKDLAYFYYNESNKAPIGERCKWSKINLKKYFSE